MQTLFHEAPMHVKHSSNSLSSENSWYSLSARRACSRQTDVAQVQQRTPDLRGRLTGSRGPITQHTLGWVNSQGYKLLRVEHGQLHHLPHLVNLFLAATNVTVGHIWLLLHSHHGDTGVNFRWQRNLNLVLCAVHPVHKRRLLQIQCAYALIAQQSAYPTLMPSSTSVGATLSPRPTTNCTHAPLSVCQCTGLHLLASKAAILLTFAICLTLITYLASSVPGFMIFVHLATYSAHSAPSRHSCCSFEHVGFCCDHAPELHMQAYMLWQKTQTHVTYRSNIWDCYQLCL